MTNHIHVNVQTGEITEVPCTAQEETDIASTTADFIAETPMREWKESMQETDKGMPRSLEDTLDMTGTTGLVLITLDKYNAKKTLRATKPD
jgi:hypothetical protein